MLENKHWGIFSLLSVHSIMFCRKFIIKKYASSLDKSTASYISGSVYDVSMVLSPFLGGVIVS